MARSSGGDVQTSVFEKFEQAKEYKSCGNERYKAKEYRGAIGKYHRALLYLKAMPWASANASIEGLSHMMNVKAKESTPEDMALRPECDQMMADCYNNIAACMLQQDEPKYERILSLCESSLALNPTNLKATYRKGVAQFNMRDYDSALEAFKKASSLPNGEKDKNINMYIVKCQKALESQNKSLQGMYKTMIGAGK